MATFGGFSTNGDISTWLSANQASFVSMVIAYSALLKSFGQPQNQTEVIRVAQKQVYPRIGLFLAGAKNTDNTYLFVDPARPATSTDYLAGVYDNVVSLMTLSSSPFSEGITSVAAALTGALLIRQLPLNADIKNIDLGNQIEKSALEDLQRIVELYKSSGAAITASVTGVTRGLTSIYIGLEIDKTTLPSTYFDAAPVNEVISIPTVYPLAQVRTLEALTIPVGSSAFCWYYMSATESQSIATGDLVVSSTPPIEGSFFLKSGDTPSSIISTLADEINSATLTLQSNILCSPNTGPATLNSLSITKKRLYENEIDPTYDYKQAATTVNQQIDYLTFEARRNSPLVSKELIIVRFFTASDLSLAPLVSGLPANTTYTFRNDWLTGTNYVLGDIVKVGVASYVSRTSNQGVNPTTSTNDWFRLYASANDLEARKSLLQDYVEGLIYGLSPSYPFLNKKGPKSLLLTVEKGTVKLPSPNSATVSSNTAVTQNDTFYFRFAANTALINGDLLIRVASLDVSKYPEIAPLLSNDGRSLKVTLTNASSPEDVALAVLKAIYSISQYTDVLGALVQPAALQIAAFKKTEGEVKEVIDILSVPIGLEVATGTSTSVKTTYVSKPRSVVVQATSFKDSIVAGITTTANALLTNGDYGVAGISKGKKSKRIQTAYDRMDLLKHNFPGYRGGL